MTLTEQWKKGELDEGFYYVKDGENTIAEYIDGYFYNNGQPMTSFSGGVDEVLAPVPSYDEWVYLHKARNDAHEIVESLTQENQQLKGLLKECRNEIDKAKNILTEDTNIDNTVIAHATLRKILTKIDNAIGEKKWVTYFVL